MSLYNWTRCAHEGIGMPGCLTCDPSKERCVARAVAVEREACAATCERASWNKGTHPPTRAGCAAAIRAREP